jgi:FAD:protein FMN transferase
MGVEATVSIADDDETKSVDAARVAFARLAELEQVMSDYRPDSELLQLCATHDVPVAASADLCEVLGFAEDVSSISDGLFDVSVGPLTLVWREARQRNTLPSAEAIEGARGRCGAEAILLDRAARTIRLARPNMRIDLGGIGKGFAAQKTIETLRAHGVRRALVAIAGDIAAGDAPQGTSGWQIDILAPSGETKRISLANAAVSTSGDREQFLEYQGVRYSHVLDPQTGIGATTHRQVSVIGPNGAIVDGVASALSIAAPAEYERIRTRLGQAYRVIAFN